MGTDVVEILRGRKEELWESRRAGNLFLWEPCVDALDILPVIIIAVQALEYQLNCPVKCLMWMLKM